MKDTTQLTAQLKQLLGALGRHALILAIIGFGLLCAYILILTMRLSSAEPSAEALAEQAQKSTSTKVDPSVVDTILGLEDQNVQVQAIFEEARENPFTE